MKKTSFTHTAILALAALAFVLTGLLSCDDGIVDDGNALVFPTPEEGKVSYLMNIQPFLRLRCATSNCHGSANPAGGRSMTDYQSITNPVSNVGFIKPFDAEASLFYQVATGANPHLQNLRLRPLTENQRQGIKRWINDGALNN